MKRILLASTALVAASAAVAADLPSKKAAPYLEPPVMTWTGFTAGLNFGGGFDNSTSVNTAAFGSNVAGSNFNGLNGLGVGPYTLGASAGIGGLGLANTGVAHVNKFGFLGGGQLAYNYQFGRFVAGVETDLDIANIRGSGSFSGASVDSYNLSGTQVEGQGFGPINVANQSHIGGGKITGGIDYFGSVRGKLGFLVTPAVLIYGTGGLAYAGAWAHADYASVTSTNLGGSEFFGPLANANIFNQQLYGQGRASKVLLGYTVGAGVDYKITHNTTIGLSGLFYDVGSLTINGSGAAPAALNLSGLVAPFGPSPALAAIAAAVPGTSALGTVSSTRVKFDGFLIRTGINYRFAGF